MSKKYTDFQYFLNTAHSIPRKKHTAQNLTKPQINRARASVKTHLQTWPRKLFERAAIWKSPIDFRGNAAEFARSPYGFSRARAALPPMFRFSRSTCSSPREPRPLYAVFSSRRSPDDLQPRHRCTPCFSAALIPPVASAPRAGFRGPAIATLFADEPRSGQRSMVNPRYRFLRPLSNVEMSAFRGSVRRQ